MKRTTSAGLTLIEVLAATVLLLVLAAAALPMLRSLRGGEQGLLRLDALMQAQLRAGSAILADVQNGPVALDEAGGLWLVLDERQTVDASVPADSTEGGYPALPTCERLRLSVRQGAPAGSVLWTGWRWVAQPAAAPDSADAVDAIDAEAEP